MEQTDQILCPKCGSNQVTANKKGFSGKKAVAGAVLTGGIGVLVGTIGSNKIKITCLACGHEFYPGQQATSKGDFDKKQADKKNATWGGLIILGVLVLFGLFGKTCNSEDPPKDEKQVQHIMDSIANSLNNSSTFDTLTN